MPKLIARLAFIFLIALPLVLGYIAFKSLESISSKIVKRSATIERSVASEGN